MPISVWITGLPGSGKSTIARELKSLLDRDGTLTEHLRLDEFRKEIVPDPKFTEGERDRVYSELIKKAHGTVRSGRNVLIDATSHRRKWRDIAREKLPGLFEVFVSCPIEICIDRESKRAESLVTAHMYRKALKRKQTGEVFEGLGEVVGVDVPYEEGSADLTVDSGKFSAHDAARAIFDSIKKRGIKE